MQGTVQHGLHPGTIFLFLDTASSGLVYFYFYFLTIWLKTAFPNRQLWLEARVAAIHMFQGAFRSDVTMES